jgi:predicted nuclease of predicted toxin-antitoxin system
MRIKLDENMPAVLAASLVELGHDAETAPAEGLAGCGDDAVWSAAQSEQRFLITQDLDFSDLRALILASHAGVMLVRLRRSSRRRLIARVHSVFATERVEDWRGCIVVVTENKVRVRRPDA